MAPTIHDIIKITAKAIESGIKPYKLIEDPTKILSGETKEIVISKYGKNIRLGENIVDRLIELGETIDKSILKWKQHLSLPGPEHKFTVWENRESTALIKLVKLGETDRLVISHVPVEDWSWIISCTDDVISQQEYILHLL
jgi:hypothetical protein